MKVFQKIAVVLAACLATIAVAACGASKNDGAKSDPTTAPDSATTAEVVANAVEDNGGKDLTGKKVGFSALMMSSEFFAGMSEQMDKYFTAKGMKYTVADANASPEQQVQNIENFVTMGMDYIILFAVDRVSICDAAIAARKAGAFVITIGTTLDKPEAYDVCINVNQNESGLVMAQLAADWIDKTFPDAADGSIEVISLETRDSEDAIARSDGMREVVNYTKKAVLVDTYLIGMAEGALKAQEITETNFLNHPNTKVILAYGTDLGGGADEIAGKSATLNKNEFAIFTIDTPEFIRDKVIDSANNGSLIRGTVMLGEGTPLTCYNLMDGSWLDRVQNQIYAEKCIPITADNIKQYFPN